MGQRWYYRRGGREIGPVTSDDLRKIVAAGVLTPEDVVRRELGSKWVPAREIKGLFGGGVIASPLAKVPTQGGSRPTPPAQPPPLGGAGRSWYMSRSGATFGPYPHDQLQEMARVGQVLPEDHLCPVGDSNWVGAQTVFPFLGKTRPPAALPKAGPPPFSAPSQKPRQEPGSLPRTADIRNENVLFKTGLHWKVLVLPWVMLLQFLIVTLIVVAIISRNLEKLNEEAHLKLVADNVDQIVNLEEVRWWLWFGFFAVVVLNQVWFLFALLRFLGGRFAITPGQLIMRGGLLSSTRETAWPEVQSFYIVQPLMGRLLGYGTLVVATSTLGSLTYKDVKNPFLFKQMADQHLMGRA